ncbi:hypothetical protein bcere0027_48050 [Bacillus cereus AH676]|nr:hypothetical protein bcere0027_48050 [Bacillus cereus AH676]
MYYNFDIGLKTPSNFFKKISGIAIFLSFFVEMKRCIVSIFILFY